MKQRNPIGEKLAKIAIYVLSCLSVGAFALFLHTAGGYSAASAPVSPPLVSPAPAASQPAPESASASIPQSEDAASIPALQAPGTGDAFTRHLDPAPDAAFLESEVARIAAFMPEAAALFGAPEYSGAYHATAYCCEVYPHICGGNGVTASGTVPTPGLTAAADWGVLPPGSWVFIEGVGIRRIEDSGSAILGARLDIAVDTHDNALRWSGFGSHNVWVLHWP